MDLIKHTELVTERLASQFQESQNLTGYIKALLKTADELDEVFLILHSLLDLENSVGAQLDLVGELVGQPRAFVPLIDPDTFTFDIGPGFDNGEFVVSQGFTQLEDEDYRNCLLYTSDAADE